MTFILLRQSFRWHAWLIMMLLATNALAQKSGNYTISGLINDAHTQNPVGYASVALYRASDTLLITGTITNDKGEFQIHSASPGHYLLKASFVGYFTETVAVEVKNTAVKLNNPVLLKSLPVGLQQVEITAEKTERRGNIEKTTIDVSKNISGQSGSIAEILKNHSAVSIDAEDNLYIRGNKNILLLIDGIPTTLGALQAIPANSAQSIEIITNPDISHDSEGTGGIIRIVSKQSRTRGKGGAANFNYGYPDRINGGAGFNFTNGIWGINFNYSGKREPYTITSQLLREIAASGLSTRQDIVSDQTLTTHNAHLSLNARLPRNNTITFGFRLINPALKNLQRITGSNHPGSLAGTHRLNDIAHTRETVESSLSYTKAFDKNKHELTLGSVFSRTAGNRPASYLINDIAVQKSEGGGAPTHMAIQADYLKNIRKEGSLSMGAKLFSRWNDFSYRFYDMDTLAGTWELNPLYSSDLEHQELITSAYLMYSDSLFRKFRFRAGARVEHSTSELRQKTTATQINHNHTFPFPYLLIQRHIAGNQMISFTLNRRITRPAYPQLNPYINVIDPITYETGNKNLVPEILDKIELQYTWYRTTSRYRCNLYLSQTTDYITQVSYMPDPENLILTYANGQNQLKLGLDAEVVVQPFRALELSQMTSLYYAHSEGNFNGISLESKDFAWTANLKADIQAAKKTGIQLFLNYNSPVSLPQFDLEGIFYADAGLKSTILGNNIVFSLLLSDVFNTRKWNATTNNPYFSLVNTSKKDTRVFWIGLSYTFNKHKADKKPEEEDGGMIRIGQ